MKRHARQATSDWNRRCAQMNADQAFIRGHSRALSLGVLASLAVRPRGAHPICPKMTQNDPFRKMISAACWPKHRPGRELSGGRSCCVNDMGCVRTRLRNESKRSQSKPTRKPHWPAKNGEMCRNGVIMSAPSVTKRTQRRIRHTDLICPHPRPPISSLVPNQRRTHSTWPRHAQS